MEAAGARLAECVTKLSIAEPSNAVERDGTAPVSPAASGGRVRGQGFSVLLPASVIELDTSALERIGVSEGLGFLHNADNVVVTIIPGLDDSPGTASDNACRSLGRADAAMHGAVSVSSAALVEVGRERRCRYSLKLHDGETLSTTTLIPVGPKVWRFTCQREKDASTSACDEVLSTWKND